MRIVVKIVRPARALLRRVFRRQTKPAPDLSGTFLKLALQYYIAGAVLGRTPPEKIREKLAATAGSFHPRYRLIESPA